MIEHYIIIRSQGLKKYKGLKIAVFCLHLQSF